MKYELKDNQPVASNIASKGLIKEISDQNLAALTNQGVLSFPAALKSSPDLSASDSYLITHYKGQLWTTNIVGFLSIRTSQLEIGLRVDSSQNQFFLRYMIYRALHLNLSSELGLNIGKMTGTKILAMFIPALLNKAMQAGIYKEYENKQFNDYQLHGAIDVKRQLKVNVPFVGKFATNGHQFTRDTELLELIRHALEAIKADVNLRNLLNRDQTIRKNVALIVANTPNYQLKNRQKVIAQSKKIQLRNNYFLNYLPLIRICRAFLEGTELQQGSKSILNGILIDAAWLFEEYIGAVIEENFVHSHNKIGQDKQYLFKDRVDKGLIYPDYLKKGEIQVPVDAKYKFPEGIASHDRLQMMAYMLRFQSNRGVLIHLSGTDVAVSDTVQIEGQYVDDESRPQVTEYGIGVSQAGQWEQFLMDMHKQEKQLCQFLSGFTTY
ncbi:hypothetical protein FD04_GL002021 [Secundilactobacillus odoratitofui DSM 19909 = JCM 15043]|uniref:5-methylcytosine-specific restriction enzyme subunit McrC n=1 Tax=Secundilactobacillus odoratitofui DSM 19909 = JCM 15043 TaxID=1423776 RepID=A0A0R1LZG5_9LACO|nr:hypothetical protein [Secundilactobacillus odoratitofui]KRK97159.1 hypothetical protein FD04_GL002021 [Secundilactobacillus odoratitofui DSM 19909 = JCM 15043]